MKHLGYQILLIALAASTTGCDGSVEPLGSPGGNWTARPSVRPTLIAPASVLDSRQKLEFWTGMGFFRDPWVTAPASTTARDGLGPLFNAQSCIACHASGGRGRSLLKNPDSVSTIVKLGRHVDHDNTAPHPELGRQLQTRAIYPHNTGERTLGAYFPGEGSLGTHKQTTDVSFTDGTLLTLQYPKIEIEDVVVGDVLTSVRIAPSLIGLGLLEAISVEALAALEDPADKNGNGISGRIHWRSHRDDRTAGRFGWKAVHPTVAEQTATAFGEDIGISNPLYSKQNCTERQAACNAQRNGNDAEDGVEITQPIFDRVVFFTAHIAPPPAAPITPQIAKGRQLFASAGCADCHTPSYSIDVVDDKGVQQTDTIWPFTDLLLHDMGTHLADSLPEGDASGEEWRTPPLWGLGRTMAINDETGLLHDGRARNVIEAIAWHGGEGESSRNQFLDFDADERAALAAFVLAL